KKYDGPSLLFLRPGGLTQRGSPCFARSVWFVAWGLRGEGWARLSCCVQSSVAQAVLNRSCAPYSSQGTTPKVELGPNHRDVHGQTASAHHGTDTSRAAFGRISGAQDAQFLHLR